MVEQAPPEQFLTSTDKSLERATQTVELPQLQTAAVAIAGAPAFATSLASQLNAFAAAVGALPGAYVPATPDYPPLGAALAALLPLTGAGAKTATLQGIEAGFDTFYAAKTNDTTGLVLADVNGCAAQPTYPASSAPRQRVAALVQTRLSCTCEEPGVHCFWLKLSA